MSPLEKVKIQVDSILYKSSTFSPSSGIKTRFKIPATSARFLTISRVTLLWFTPSRCVTNIFASGAAAATFTTSSSFIITRPPK